MKRIFSILALLLVLAAPGVAGATDAGISFDYYEAGGVKLVQATWVGNGTTGGPANATTSGRNLLGEIVGFRHVMGDGNGTAAITVKDSTGLDVLQGLGSGLVNGTVQVNGTQGSTSKFLPVVGPMTFQLDDFYTGGGTFYLWIR